MKIFKLFFVLVFVVIFDSVFAENQKCLKNVSNTKLLCFYSEITTLKGCKCTHVIVPSSFEAKIIKKLKETNQNVKIVVTIDELNQATISLIKSSNPHGLNLNLKSFDKITSPNDVLDVITTIRTKIDSKLEIIVTVPSKIEILARFFDFKRLKKLGVEAFVLQSDFLTVSKAVTFHPSRLSGLFDVQNTDSLVDLVTNLGLPESKLIISIPVQGYHFKLENETKATPGSPAVEVRSINRDEMCKKIDEFSDWKEGRDQDLTGVYIYRKRDWISFEDIISIDIKAKYARIRGLYGLALKDLSQDLTENNNCQNQTISILDATYRSLSKQPRAPRGAILQSLKREILYKDDDNFEINNFHSNQNNQKSEVNNLNLPCPHQGYFTHPDDCNRFYRCVQFYQPAKSNSQNSFTIFQFSCPSGLTFDERYEVCTWPLNLQNTTRCHGSSEIAPVSTKKHFSCPSEVGFYADLNDCRWFYACLDHGLDDHLTAYEFRCPFGLVFDEEKLMCEWPWMVTKCYFDAGLINVNVFGGNSQESKGIYSLNGLNVYDGLGVLKTVNLGNLNFNVGNGEFGHHHVNANQNLADNLNLNTNIGQFGANSAGFEVNFDKNFNGNIHNYNQNSKNHGFGVNSNQNLYTNLNNNEKINLAGNLNLNTNIGQFGANSDGFEGSFDKNLNQNVQNYDKIIKIDDFGTNFGQKLTQNINVDESQLKTDRNLNQNFRIDQSGVNFGSNFNNFDQNIKTDGFEVSFDKNSNENVGIESNFGQKFDQNVNFEVNSDKNSNQNIGITDFGSNFGQKLTQNVKIDESQLKTDRNSDSNVNFGIQTNLNNVDVNSGQNVNKNIDKTDSIIFKNQENQNSNKNFLDIRHGTNFEANNNQNSNENVKLNTQSQIYQNQGGFYSNYQPQEVIIPNSNVGTTEFRISHANFEANSPQKLKTKNIFVSEANQNLNNFGFYNGGFSNGFNAKKNVEIIGGGFSAVKTFKNRANQPILTNLEGILPSFHSNLPIIPTVKTVPLPEKIDLNRGGVIANIPQLQINVDSPQNGYFYEKPKINFEDGEKKVNLGQIRVNFDGFQSEFDQIKADYEKIHGNLGKIELNHHDFGQRLINSKENLNQNVKIGNSKSHSNVNFGTINTNGEFGQNQPTLVQIQSNYDENLNHNVKIDGSNSNSNLNFGKITNVGEFEQNRPSLVEIHGNVDENQSNLQHFGQIQSNYGENLNQNVKIDSSKSHSNLNFGKINSNVEFEQNQPTLVQIHGNVDENQSNLQHFGQIQSNYGENLNQNVKIDSSNSNSNLNLGKITNVVEFEQNRPSLVEIHGNVDENQSNLGHFEQIQSNYGENLNQNVKIDSSKSHSNLNFGKINSNVDFEQNEPTLVQIHGNVDSKLQHFGQFGENLNQNVKIDSSNSNSNLNLGKITNVVEFEQNRPSLVQIHGNVDENQNNLQHFGQIQSNYGENLNQNVKIDSSNSNSNLNFGKITNVVEFEQNRPSLVQIHGNVDENLSNLQHFGQIQSNYGQKLNQNVKIDSSKSYSNLNFGKINTNVEFEQNQPTLVQIHGNVDENQSNLQHFGQIQSNFEDNFNQNVKIDTSKSNSNLNFGKINTNVEFEQNQPTLVHIHGNVDENQSNLQRFGQIQSNYGENLNQNVKIDSSNLNSNLNFGKTTNVVEFEQNRPSLVEIHGNVDEHQSNLQHFEQIQSNYGQNLNQNVKIDSSKSHSNLNFGKINTNAEFEQVQPTLVQIHGNVDENQSNLQHFGQIQSNYAENLNQNVKIDSSNSHSNLNFGKINTNVEFGQKQPNLIQIQSNYGENLNKNVKIASSNSHSNLNFGKINTNVEFEQPQPNLVQIHGNVDENQSNLQHFEQIQSNYGQNLNQNVKIDSSNSHSNLNFGKINTNVEFEQPQPNLVQIHGNVDENQSNLQHFEQIQSNYGQNLNQNVKIDSSKSHSNLNFGKINTNAEFEQVQPTLVQIHGNVDENQSNLQHFGQIQSNYGENLNQNVKIDSSNSHSNLNFGQINTNVEFGQKQPLIQIQSNYGENLNQNVKIDSSKSHSNLNFGKINTNAEFEQPQPNLVQIPGNVDENQSNLQHFEQIQSNYGQKLNQNVKIDSSNSNSNLKFGKVTNVVELEQNRPSLVEIHGNIDENQSNLQHFGQIQSNFEDNFNQNVKIDSSNSNSNLNFGQINTNVEFGQKQPNLIQIQSNYGENLNQNVKIDSSKSHSNLNFGKINTNVEFEQPQPNFVQIHGNVDENQSNLQHFEQIQSNYGQKLNQNVKIGSSNSNSNLKFGKVTNVVELEQNRPSLVEIHGNIDENQSNLQQFVQIQSNFEDNFNQNVKIDTSKSNSNLNFGKINTNVEFGQNQPNLVQLHENLKQDTDQNVKIDSFDSHSKLNFGQIITNLGEFEQNQPNYVQIHSNLDQHQSNFKDSNQNIKIRTDFDQFQANLDQINQNPSIIIQNPVIVTQKPFQNPPILIESEPNPISTPKPDEYLNLQPVKEIPFVKTTTYQTGNPEKFNFDINLNQNNEYYDQKSQLNVENLNLQQIKTNFKIDGDQEPIFGQKLNKNVKIDTSKINSNLNLNENVKIDGFQSNFDQINLDYGQTKSKLDQIQLNLDDSRESELIVDQFDQNIEKNKFGSKLATNFETIPTEKPYILIKNQPNPVVINDYAPIEIIKIKENVKDCPDTIELNQEDIKKIVKTTSKPNKIVEFYEYDRHQLKNQFEANQNKQDNNKNNQYLIETSNNNQKLNKKVIEFFEIDQDKLKNQEKFTEIDQNQERNNQDNHRKVTKIKIHRIPKTKQQTSALSINDDFNPILTLKLGAQCTCVSNPIIVKTRTAKSDENNLESDQFDVNKTDLSRNNRRKRPNLNRNLPENVKNDSLIINSKNGNQIKNDKFEVSSERSRIQSKNSQNRRKLDQNNQKLVEFDQKLVEIDQQLVEIDQKPLQKPFNRYGPGGLRSNEETLQGIDCKRPGLFRHPTECSKFCSCVFDSKKNRFKLYVFDCPVHLTFDQTLSACNWPGKGPACVKNTLITVD